MSWYIHPSKQLRDDELPPELVVTNRDGSIEQVYVPETRLYSLEERATCNAWTIRRLKGDNAKLRELAKEMYCVISENNSLWDFRRDETKAFHQQLQELGIEVGE